MSRKPSSDAERMAWLRLARTQNVGPSTFAALLARFGTAAAALTEVPHLARRGGAASDLRIASEKDAQREIEGLAKLGGRIVCSCDDAFPAGLSALDAPPPVLSVLGRLELLSREMIAIVGARNASALGRKLAAQLALDLGRSDYVVASGLARGIDAAAHEAALSSGTCAVVAGGIDIIYPPEHADLYARIKRDGVVVSEMPLGQPPQARHFPRRNRIISGMSRGVIVVEAAEGSGSLITANYALEQGREVFAVPGSPLDPRAKGTNRLIRDGATLTETADDVLEVLRAQRSGFREPGAAGQFPAVTEAELAKSRSKIAELLGPGPVSVNELARLAGVPVAIALGILLELELAGRVDRHPGGSVSGRDFDNP